MHICFPSLFIMYILGDKLSFSKKILVFIKFHNDKDSNILMSSILQTARVKSSV